MGGGNNQDTSYRPYEKKLSWRKEMKKIIAIVMLACFGASILIAEVPAAVAASADPFAGVEGVELTAVEQRCVEGGEVYVGYTPIKLLGVIPTGQYHTLTVVSNGPISNNNDVKVYESGPDNNWNNTAQRYNPPEKVTANTSGYNLQKVSPQPGMSQNAFDALVSSYAKTIQAQEAEKKWAPFPSSTQSNCNVVTKKIMNSSGASVTPTKSTPGWKFKLW
jgi:hypothetical protein